jgi:hypothetical protein
VLSIRNAKAYFDPSTLIKETRKNWATQLIKLPKIRKRFSEFLKSNARTGYLTEGGKEEQTAPIDEEKEDFSAFLRL